MGIIHFDGGTINKQGVSLQQAIGKNIVCDDGVERRVVEIVHSRRYKDRAVINENDPQSQMGHFVHLLSLTCQLLGNPLPTQEQKEAFTRYTDALYYEETKDEQQNRWLRVLKKLQNS